MPPRSNLPPDRRRESSHASVGMIFRLGVVVVAITATPHLAGCGVRDVVDARPGVEIVPELETEITIPAHK